MIFHRSSIRRLIRDKVGQRTFSIFFKKAQFLDLMIINFENAASNKSVVQNAKSL